MNDQFSSLEIIVHSGIVRAFGVETSLYYILRGLDTKGCGKVVTRKYLDFGLTRKSLLARLKRLVSHGLVRSFSFTGDSLTAYLSSPKQICTKNNLEFGTCGWFDFDLLKDIVKNVTLMTAQSIQSSAGYKIRIDKEDSHKNSVINSRDLINVIQTVEVVRNLTRDQILADRHILPAILGKRVIGYNSDAKTLIVPEVVPVACASYAAIGKALQISPRTVSRHLSSVSKVRIAYWSPNMSHARYASDEPGKFISFKRSNGTSMVCRLGCNLLLDDEFVIVSKRFQKMVIKSNQSGGASRD
jgi:DNA-binding transcriptional ArsR family regulator